MARKVGLAQATAKTIADRAPRLLIIAGATGSGKSTAALKIAAKSKFARIISTDAIREIMRSCDEEGYKLHCIDLHFQSVRLMTQSSTG